jgi:hypothetical protein
MMRQMMFVAVLALAISSPTSAQQKDKDKKAPPPPSPKTISLSGCVVRDEKTPDQITLDDLDSGKYRLSGIKMHDYVGQRVEVAGGVVETKKLTIKGGLTPNANVAAQAGAMDPARAAVASASGVAGPGNVDDLLLEFKVKSVRPVSGGCPN